MMRGRRVGIIMYSIGEFARLGGVSVRMLRHYDQLGLLPAAAVDAGTGYRRYTAIQLGQLNRIVALKELGFSLKQIEQLLGEVDADELHGMLLLRRAQLEQELRSDQTRLVQVEARLRAIEKEDQLSDDIVIRSLPALRVAAIAKPAPGFGPVNLSPILVPAHQELRALLDKAGVVPSGPPFAFYTGDNDHGDLVAYTAYPVADDVTEICVPVEILFLPEVPEAATVIRSGFSIWPRVYADLAQWLEGSGYEHFGAGRDVWLEGSRDDPNHNVAEIQWPLRRVGGPAPEISPQPVESTLRVMLP